MHTEQRTDGVVRKRKGRRSGVWSCVVVALVSVWGCQRPMPRPVGYERMTFAPSAYVQRTPEGLPFGFEVERRAHVRVLPSETGYRAVALEYPEWKAVILCSYCEITPQTFATVAAESYELVFRHTVMATAIDKEIVRNPERGVYGQLYFLAGKVATPYQVELTDSVRHFFRASLTVNTTINTDSLAPLYEHLLGDIRRLVNTFEFAACADEARLP